MRFFMMIVLLAGVATAQEPLPSLPGLGDMTVQDADGLADPTFPTELEDRGELYNAALEWQRLAHTASGLERAQALFRLGRLYQRLGEHQAALNTYEQFGLEFADSPLIPEALYRMSRSAAALGDATAAQVLVKRALDLFPHDDWTQAAQYRLAWHAALAGEPLPPVTAADDPSTTVLRAFVAEHGDGRVQAMVSAGMSVVPGLGHALLGAWRTALVALLLNGLLIWAVIFALQRRHWPYAVIWGLLLAVLWSGTAQSAYELALWEARQARLLALTQADALHPQLPASRLAP